MLSWLDYFICIFWILNVIIVSYWHFRSTLLLILPVVLYLDIIILLRNIWLTLNGFIYWAFNVLAHVPIRAVVTLLFIFFLSRLLGCLCWPEWEELIHFWLLWVLKLFVHIFFSFLRFYLWLVYLTFFICSVFEMVSTFIDIGLILGLIIWILFSQLNIWEFFKALFMLEFFIFHLLLKLLQLLMIFNLLLRILITVFRNLHFDVLSLVEDIPFLLFVSIDNLIEVFSSCFNLISVIIKYPVLDEIQFISLFYEVNFFSFTFTKFIEFIFWSLNFSFIMISYLFTDLIQLLLVSISRSLIDTVKERAIVLII